MEIKEYIEEYIRNIKNINIKSKQTVNAYSNVLNNYLTFLNKKGIKDINLITYSLNESFILEEKVSKKETTINQEITVLKSFFNYLNDKNGIINNAILLKSFKKEKDIPEILDEFDIEKLITKRNDSNDEILISSLFDIMYSCGLRVSEACDIKINNIDFNEKFIRVYGKGDKYRYIPVPNSCIVNVKNYLKIREINNKNNLKFLFINRQGKQLNRKWIYRHLINRCNELNIKCNNIHPHILRHSYASALINRGVDLRVIQILLGHEDISTTEIYTHLLDDKIIDEYKRCINR